MQGVALFTTVLAAIASITNAQYASTTSKTTAKFPEPFDIVDPHFYATVFSNFKSCRQSKCDNLPHSSYGSYDDALASVGQYTACVTSCASSEWLRVTNEFKTLFGTLFDIGTHNLATARSYLAGASDFDVIGNRTRIGDSCCLPNDYFVDFDKVVFHSPLFYKNGNAVGGGKKYLVTVRNYLDHCSSNYNENAYFLGNLHIKCDQKLTEYFEELQRNVGHLILAQKAGVLAPNGGCCDRSKGKYDDDEAVPNPRAIQPISDMCVAYNCEEEDGTTTHLEVPIVKPVDTSAPDGNLCPDDQDGSHGQKIKFNLVPKQALEIYSVSTGLPKRDSNRCKYTQGLVTAGFDATTISVSGDTLKCIRERPREQLYEYCHVKQYVTFLQNHLFDLSMCPIHDPLDVVSESNPEGPNSVSSAASRVKEEYSLNLVCLYRIFSLKCDCMEAVLQCYEHEYHFSSILGKTVGKAAAIFCGFILCQKRNIYALFGGQSAVHHAQIFKNVLLQLGAMEADSNMFPAASFAFLSFGLGMVAFVATKKVYNLKSKNVQVDGGYQHLI